MLTILPNVFATSSITRPIQLKGEAADWNVPQNAASVQMARPLYLAMMKAHRWTVMISWNPPRTINQSEAHNEQEWAHLISIMLIIVDWA
jgi:hypothetical protein